MSGLPNFAAHWPYLCRLTGREINQMPQEAVDCGKCDSRVLGIFCDLDKFGLKGLNNAKTTNFYKKGQFIFYEQHQALGLYCIYSGKVKLSRSSEGKKEEVLRVAGPGELLDSHSLLGDEPYPATAVAQEDTVVCFIEKHPFLKLLRQNPDILKNPAFPNSCGVETPTN